HRDQLAAGPLGIGQNVARVRDDLRFFAAGRRGDRESVRGALRVVAEFFRAGNVAGNLRMVHPLPDAGVDGVKTLLFRLFLVLLVEIVEVAAAETVILDALFRVGRVAAALGGDHVGNQLVVFLAALGGNEVLLRGGIGGGQGHCEVFLQLRAL